MKKSPKKPAGGGKTPKKAATTPEERARMAAGRQSIEPQRLDWEEAERKRAAEGHEREIRRLKPAPVADLRAAEAKANQGKGAAPQKVVPWWDGPKPDGHTAGN